MTDEQRKDEELMFTVASVWREERVSCPHPDILKAHLAAALEPAASSFVEFHLNESQCPYCNAVADDLRACEGAQAAGGRGGEPDGLEASRDRVMRSTVSALRRANGE